MKSEKEIKELKDELSKLTSFISDFGLDDEWSNEDVNYCNNIADGLDWVLEEITTERFKSDAYLNINNIKNIFKKIEKRTGKKFEDYQ